MRARHRARRGATVVEAAIVYPAVMLFVIGLVVGAVGILRYQEVASLARRAARYACVRGGQYARDTGATSPSPADIYATAVKPYAVGFDMTRLSCSVSYASGGSQLYQTTLANGQYVYTTNTVSVTVSYNWVPEAFLGGITLKSTSVMPMAY